MPVLPIKFTSIYGQKVDTRKARISWSIYTDELLPSNFIIKRSADTIRWLKLADVLGNAPAGTNQSYSFTDTDPLGG